MKFKNFLRFIPLMLILILLDQLSKSYFIMFLKNEFGLTYKITSWFSLVYAWNYGISFGLFSEYFQHSNYAFIGINCLITGYLIAILSSSNDKMQSIALSFIIGGALGNLIDRIYRGAVFDFLFFHYEKHSFPAFNLADSFINIGVMLMLLSLFYSRKRNL